MLKRRSRGHKYSAYQVARNARQRIKFQAKLASWAAAGTLRIPGSVDAPIQASPGSKPEIHSSTDGNNNLPQGTVAKTGPVITSISFLSAKDRFISPVLAKPCVNPDTVHEAFIPLRDVSVHHWEAYFPSGPYPVGETFTYEPTPRHLLSSTKATATIEEEIEELSRLLQATPYEAPSPRLVLTPVKTPPTVDLVTPPKIAAHVPIISPIKNPPEDGLPVLSPDTLRGLEDQLHLSEDDDILELSPGSPFTKSPTPPHDGARPSHCRQLWDKTPTKLPSLLDLPILVPEDLSKCDSHISTRRAQERRPYDRSAERFPRESKSRYTRRSNEQRLKNVARRFKNLRT